MTIPDCTLSTACFDLSAYSPGVRKTVECLERMDVVLSLPVYLVIYANKSVMPCIRKRREEYGLGEYSRFIEREFEDLWVYPYLETVRSNRGRYWPTRDARTCAESHLITCNKFDFILETIETNPFGTSRFGWLDAYLSGPHRTLRICEDYSLDKLLEALDRSTEKYHIQILNVVDKKYKLPENKREYYSTYQYVVCGGFMTCGREVGLRILPRLKEIFVETTEAGYGHGEEMLYLEVLDEFYDDIHRSYGDYGQIINNFIHPRKNIGYVYHVILARYAKFGYLRELYDASMALLKAVREDNLSLDAETMTGLLRYRTQGLPRPPNPRLVVALFACDSEPRYKAEMLKIQETWGAQAETLGVPVLFFLGGQGPTTDRLIRISATDDYHSTHDKQNLGLRYVHDHFNPNFVFCAGTDTFVCIRRLLSYLDAFTPQQSLYLGGHGATRSLDGRDYYFHSGGAGFLLSQQCLSDLYRPLVSLSAEWKDVCRRNNQDAADKRDYFINETSLGCDVAIAYCIAKELGGTCEVVTNNDGFFGCNYRGLCYGGTYRCCADRIVFKDILTCHCMSPCDVDDFFSLLSS